MYYIYEKVRNFCKATRCYKFIINYKIINTSWRCLRHEVVNCFQIIEEKKNRKKKGLLIYVYTQYQIKIRAVRGGGGGGGSGSGSGSGFYE